MDGSLQTLTAGMSDEKKAVFQRVWRRVMGSPEEDALPPETADASSGEEPDLPRPAEAALLPAAAPGRRGGDYPAGETGVLGESCLEFTGLLQGMIRRKLAGWRSLQALARRAGGGPGRVLSALAAGERRQAKELCAVCFLISGVRYWPEPEAEKAPASYLAALRREFRQAQASMAAYLAAGELTDDPCLRELFLRHAGQDWDRAGRIRALVEEA